MCVYVYVCVCVCVCVWCSYCQCFTAKTVCTPACSCVSCANTSDNFSLRQDAVRGILERNPNAFASKFKPVSQSVPVPVPVPSLPSSDCFFAWLALIFFYPLFVCLFVCSFSLWGWLVVYMCCRKIGLQPQSGIVSQSVVTDASVNQVAHKTGHVTVSQSFSGNICMTCIYRTRVRLSVPQVSVPQEVL